MTCRGGQFLHEMPEVEDLGHGDAEDGLAHRRAPDRVSDPFETQRLYGSRPRRRAVSSASRERPYCSRCAIALAVSGS